MLTSPDLENIREKLEKRENPTEEVLVVEGDSWFRYGPFGNNVLSELENLGYHVKAVVHIMEIRCPQ